LPRSQRRTRAASRSGTRLSSRVERWLRDLDGFQGFLLPANEEQALEITFWASREVAEHCASMRSTFRERVLSLPRVPIADVVDYDVAFARFARFWRARHVAAPHSRLTRRIFAVRASKGRGGSS
jgi:hypothetical protein